MRTDLSDQLKAERNLLRQRGRFGLFLMPCGIRRLVTRFNTFIALAEELEDDLHLAELRELRDQAQAGARVLRLPGFTFVTTRTDDRNGP